jgi:putative flavoprotein involved in K+ transport
MDAVRGEHIETIVIGGGQAGLSVGYHLSQLGRGFVILDAGERVGDAWRYRWDSLRLFTPAKFDGLDGMPFPAPANSFPTKDDVADYLESYADRFALPVRSGVRVDALTHDGSRFVVRAGHRRYTADNVVVAMSNYQQPRIPEYAAQLDPGIVQLHSHEYRNPDQLRPGGVLVVGAGNSGAEIGIELARTHPTYLSGRDTGHIPFRIDGTASRWVLARLVLRGVFHRVLTVATPIGRKVRGKVLGIGGPLIRLKPRDLTDAGIQRVARLAGVRDGLPRLADGRVPDVANIVWCTGYRPGFSWIRLPVLEGEEPRHDRGLVPDLPGLYFVGLHFLYALSSVMIHGVGRDARRIASAIAAVDLAPSATRDATARSTSDIAAAAGSPGVGQRLAT